MQLFYWESEIMKYFDVELLDALTGRVGIKNISGMQLSGFQGKWELTVDDRICGGGRFLPGDLAPDAGREILLSVEIPPVYPGEKIGLTVFFYNRENVGCGRFYFDLPPVMYKAFPKDKNEYITAIRPDISSAMISSGKLSAVITSGGMRELRYRGTLLTASAPRLSLWQYGCDKCEKIKALELDRIRISADRFTSDECAVECHALALPRRMDLDELEFTQRFVPLSNGAIRYETEFIVPESFAGLPRIGVEFSLVPELTGVYRFPAAGAMEFAAFTGADGNGLLIAAAGYPVIMTVLPGDEYTLLEHPEIVPDGKLHVAIDCRNAGIAPVGAGRYRMMLIFAPLTAAEDPALKARMLRMG